MFGNILFGEGVGAIIDHSKGTAYSYTDWVRVIKGDHLIFDRRNNRDAEVMPGLAASQDNIKKIEDAKIKRWLMQQQAILN